jgi:hypothetical protein
MQLVINDIDPSLGLFWASISNAKGEELTLTCSFWTDEFDSLYGDQVKAIHVMGYFDSIEKVEAVKFAARHDEGLTIAPPQDLLAEAKRQLEDVEFEIETIPQQVDYSARYYDLI